MDLLLIGVPIFQSWAAFSRNFAHDLSYQSHCPKWGKTTPLAWRTFISKHIRYRCQTIIPVRQRISYEAFLWFRRIRTKYLPKSFLRENNSVTGRISPMYKKYYNLIEVLYIFPMIFKMKTITITTTTTSLFLTLNIQISHHGL